MLRRFGPMSVVLLVVSLFCVGCPAIFPELSTRMGVAPKLQTFDPPPPPDRHFISIKGAKLPSKTRDGRAWSEAFGSLPDPYLKVIVNENELFRTDSESDTTTPTWPRAPRGNWPLKVGDVLRVEVWDENPLIDHPIGLKEIKVSSDFFTDAEHEFPLDDYDSSLTMTIEAAHPVWGAGLWFELRSTSAYVTRVLDGSPASRGGIKGGDRIISIGGNAVERMSTDDVTGFLRAIPIEGRPLVLQHDDGTSLQVTLKEGPIYAFFKDVGDPSKPSD